MNTSLNTATTVYASAHASVKSIATPYTQLPDLILDWWMAELSESELKVVLYIARRTYGFQKTSDAISISQMVDGKFSLKTGERLDNGTGLSKTSVIKAIASLVVKGLLIQHRQSHPKYGDLASVYSLNLETLFGRERVANVPEAHLDTGTFPLPPVSEILTPPLSNMGLPPVQNRDTPVSKICTHKKQHSEKQIDRQIEKQQHRNRDKQETQTQPAVPVPDSEKLSVSNPQEIAVAPATVPLINNALNAVLALGISEADAVSILKEVGGSVALEQAGWWTLRKCSQTVQELGAAFRTACRNRWTAPPAGKPKPKPVSPDLGTKPRSQSRQNDEDYEPALKVVTAPKQPTQVSVPSKLSTQTPHPSVSDPAWGHALETLKNTISIPTMQSHMCHLVPVSTKPGEWVLAAPSAFSADWINRRYLRDLERVATAIAEMPTTVQVIIARRDAASYAS